jgi:N-acetyl-anhydromuramyl-L-alanine amidase AmpD
MHPGGIFNYNERPAGTVIRGMVIHCTSRPQGVSFEATLNATLNWFQNPTANASAHGVIGRDGVVYDIIDWSKRAWHAGIHDLPLPSWMGGNNPNDVTVGYEIVAAPEDGYSDEQYRSLAWIIENDLEPFEGEKRFCRHSDLYTGRPSDPGPLFSYEVLDTWRGWVRNNT